MWISKRSGREEDKHYQLFITKRDQFFIAISWAWKVHGEFHRPRQCIRPSEYLRRHKTANIGERSVITSNRIPFQMLYAQAEAMVWTTRWSFSVKSFVTFWRVLLRAYQNRARRWDFLSLTVVDGFFSFFDFRASFPVFPTSLKLRIGEHALLRVWLGSFGWSCLAFSCDLHPTCNTPAVRVVVSITME